MSASTSSWAQEPYLVAFRKAATQAQQASDWDPKLICRVGYHIDCAVLKLQKADWTNDDLKTMANQTGVFFSIWVSEKGARVQRVDYNIHALQLRKINGHRLISKVFASEFRAEFAKSASLWPNVRTDFGPLTLMQGHVQSDINQLNAHSVELIQKFDPLIGVVDRLYADHRK